MVNPEQMETAEPPTDGSEYDFWIGRAFAAARREAKRLDAAQENAARAAGQPPAPLPTLPDPPLRRDGRAWEQCERLLAAAQELRHDDPAEMLLVASAAAALAQSLDPTIRDVRALANLQARTLAELANAHRVSNDPITAELILGQALERWDAGTREPLILARLLDLTASLYVDQRRFEEALQLLAWSFDVYRAAGEHHHAGRALLQKGVARWYGGEPAEAIDLFSTALRLLDPGRDPKAALAGVHSLICCLVECGHFTEAWDALWEARALYAAHGGALHQIKLVWLEGRVTAGRGHFGRAERCFRKARQAFLERKLPYYAAVAAFDLGALLLERRHTAESRELVLDTLDTFDMLHIRREASAALILLGEAARQDALTVEILKRAAADLEKVER
jgi:tetratricopeptide (TPR) repeat protein